MPRRETTSIDANSQDPAQSRTRNPATNAPAAQVSSLEQPVLQRTPACSCGGGCPRCLQKSASQVPSAGVDSPDEVHKTAAAGVQGAGAQLPHLDRIQDSFGEHDVTAVRSHIDEASAQAAKSINASAYTLGGDVAFDGEPDLFTAAHEAAHVVQQRAGVQLKGGVGQAGDRFEQQADAVAERVVKGDSARDLLGQIAPRAARTAEASRPTVQREELKKVRGPVSAKHSAIRAEAATTVDAGLAKIDDAFVAGTKKVRLTICEDTEFELAWEKYVDRAGRSGARMEEGLNGFVDPTYPGGKMGFVRKTAGVGTAIHEAMHQHAHENFTTDKVGRAINEGTTELFTRIVIGYAGGKIERNVYEKEKNAMLRLQGISGLTALAQWYFRGDRAAVEKALGSKLSLFTYWMGKEDMDGAIAVL